MNSLLQRLFLLFSLLCLSLVAQAQQVPVAPVLAAKSWVLVESGSNQFLAAEKPDAKLEPASLTKLMTAYLTFSALRQKTIALDQPVPVSERAWRTGGSKMFIKVGDQVPVEELIKGMIVQSGNDACVALAEAIAGSEEAFAVMMNREAERLGMKSSHFKNSTGLPDPEHVTTARDLATLASALIRDFPEEYARYYSMKEYRYNNITQPNRNRLLWLDPTVDGVKTGFTEAAGYCLISSAKRGERRLLSVVLGTDSDAARASESLKLLNWGFQFFDALKLYAALQPVSEFQVWKGAQNRVKAGFPADFVVSVPKGYGDKLQAELVSTQPLVAPVRQGQVIGTLKLSLEGRPYGEYPVQALEDVPLGSWLARLIDTIRLWFA
ncbi:D-alanyl-D-alanine carboxypeptidase family protein [Azovibrio restrictus]|uniref:D-alanyl-D-alanine carboxypeptidase family protein n=1 Tax=Azovibrio restrictus TaxID=146938 RepID=UPI0026ECCD02|nr:D-alanyl-D-alanine carboxypeptidase family protein [Azovibrio restrictus]